MQRLRIAILTAAALAFGTVPVVAAQDPAASPTPLAAAECTVAPITFEELTSTLATPVAESAAPEASPTPAVMPEGTPADDATSTAVQETIAQLTACLNAGELRSTLALYSDRFLQETFAGLELTQEIFDEQLTSEEPRVEGEQVVLYSFGEVVITDDGRAAVVAVGDDLGNDEGEASGILFYLVQDGETWRIDETADDLQVDES
ncbi:MAG: hypothetical protein IT336_01120 [Thermomicrobiales bacterium]|nr:hypothetical protein [Thermomicrobiales bacterium]